MDTAQTTKPIPTLPPEVVRVLHDSTKRVAYALAMETVDELRRDPGPLLRTAREWRRQHPIAHGPVQALWDELLNGPVDDLCRALLGLDDRGELLRDTMPVFGACEESRRLAIARAAYHAHT